MFDLGTSFIASVKRDPFSIAISYKKQSLSYIDWFKLISNLSGSLLKLGMKKGDKILTILQNNFQACTLYWACQIVGITLVPVNWRVKRKEIDFFLKDSEAKSIIYEEFSSEDVKLSEYAKNLIKISVNSKIEDCINFD